MDDDAAQRNLRISENLVRLVQVIFSLVLAQSLLLYKEVLLHPFGSNAVATTALIVIYLTTIFSWVEWHITMSLRPYNMGQTLFANKAELGRLLTDLFIVSVYAFILFSISYVQNDPNGSLSDYLAGFAVIFLAYLWSGILRIRSHGQAASRPRAIIEFFFCYLVVWASYLALRHSHIVSLRGYGWEAINILYLVAAILLTILYRLRRQVLKNRRAEKDQGPHIGVDIDGVLADQITGVLPRVRETYGVDLSYKDITDWQLRINSSADIKTVILKALSDPSYVSRMPVHSGAKTLLDSLLPVSTVSILTARPSGCRKSTMKWLRRNHLKFDEFINTKEGLKGEHGTNYLIDDFIGNASQFLATTSGVVFLIDQPWNQDRAQIQDYISTGRALVAKNLSEVLPLVLEQVRKDATRDPTSSGAEPRG